jgi:uncharacterized protein YbjQ (UPF0145 family)
MTAWNGKGLPPVAQARIERFQRSPVHTSLLSVPSAFSLESAGFDLVGEVMGSAVMYSAWYPVGGCGYAYGGGPARVYGTSSRWNGYGPYVQRVIGGYRTALNRLSAEATGMAADGVVGIRISERAVAEGCHEYSVMGTAVRARSRTRAPKPFTTDLSGTEVAKLLMSGWVPASLELAMEVAIRHDDQITRTQAGSLLMNQANVEIAGYTELATYTRAAARQKLAAKVSAAGADGVVVSSVTFSMYGRENGPGHSDHIAESVIVGTTIASFGTRAAAPPKPLSILPLTTKARRL